MSDPVTVRRADVADADAIARVQVETWRFAYRRIVPALFLAAIDHAERATRWREGLNDRADRRTTWVAEDGGELVGFVAFGRCRDEDASVGDGELDAIYVLAGSWRRGIGTALHDVCIAELRRAGCGMVTAWMFDANAEAKAFYTALGWKADGAAARRDFAGSDLPLVRYRRLL